jgi:hypothetical protein
MRRLLYIGLGLLLPALGCGGDEEPSGPPAPTSITLVSGGSQTGPVGTGLPLPVVVRISAGSQPLAGARVSFAASTGGGSLSPSSVTTDANGTATANWILGGTLGDQTATATVSSLTPLAITATATTGPPAALLPVAGVSQFGVVARPVNQKPRVRLTDAFGNPIAGTQIRFEVTAGGGTVSGDLQVTDAGGHAELGSWTLGPLAGINRVLASANANIATEVIAIGTPASIVAQAGSGQTVNAGTLAPVPPSVRALDGDGQPLANVDITFIVASGGGRVTGATQRTDAQGIARVGGWILGATPGQNLLRATSPGVPDAQFTATGVAAVAAGLTATSAQNVSGLVGNFLSATPSVRVTDAGGKPVAGAQVTFDIASGGGTVASPAVHSFGLVTLAGAVVLSDFNGDAALGAWRLGSLPGSQSVTATIADVAPVTFTADATPIPPAEYDIEIRYVGSTQPTDAQRAAFNAAVARWEEVILGDVGDEHVVWEATNCFPALDELIDDLIIYAELVAIDGAGGVLGSAGPCLIRDTGPTGVGRMRFDTADLAALESSGNLDEVVLHEMAHVIGIGSLWTEFDGLFVGGGGNDPHFTGPAARAAWRVAAANLGFTGNIVPVENTGGPGTRDSHWRESLAQNELMTGFLDNGENPLSIFSIASLRDIGYVVNDAVADDLLLLPLLRAAPGAPLQLREVPLTGDILVVRGGRVVRTIHRPRF